MMHKRSIFSLLFYMVLKWHCYLSISFWTSKNISSTFFVCLLLKCIISAGFWSWTCNCIAARVVLHFNLEKHHSYFHFSFLTTVHLFYCLFSGLETPNKDTAPWSFVERVQKRNCYFPVRNLTFKIISSALFFVCLSLNM